MSDESSEDSNQRLVETADDTGRNRQSRIEKKDSFREIHDLKANTSTYGLSDQNPPESEDLTKYDFEPKINSSFFSPESKPVTDEFSGDEVSELRTKDGLLDQNPPKSEDLTKYDFEPKINSNCYSPESKPVTDKFSGDEVPELRTKVQTHEIKPVKMVTRQLASCKTANELMDEHKSYHEEITGIEAEKRLKLCSSHGYLTRHSKENQHYILSVCKETATDYIFKHFPIVFTNDGTHKEYRIGERGKVFKSLQEMLQFYERSRIGPALKTIGQCVTEREYIEEMRAQAQPQPPAQAAPAQAAPVQAAPVQPPAQVQVQPPVPAQTQPQVPASASVTSPPVNQRQRKCTIL